MTSAIEITGAPGSGKSSAAQAFTTLLDNAGITDGRDGEAVAAELQERGLTPFLR